jgi:hypothetical protein
MRVHFYKIGAIGALILIGGVEGYAQGGSSSTANPQYSWCTPMSDGEYRVIAPGDQNVSILGVSYKLIKSTDSKTGSKVYDAVLNLNFIPNPGETKDVIPAMGARFNECFAELGPIVGPEGEFLRVRTPRASDPGPVPGSTNVFVLTRAMPREERSNLWSTHSGCPLIIHETMHLLGLVDLYPETGIGWAQDGSGKWIEVQSGATMTMDNCRSTAGTGSVMTSDMNEYVERTQPSYSAMHCACETSACAAILDRIQSVPESCPEGTASSDGKTRVAWQFEMDTNPSALADFKSGYELMEKGVRHNRWDYDFLKTYPADVTSILYPAEFRAITQPGCAQANHLYLECSSNAYRTTEDHTPEAYKQDGGCINNTPVECHDLRWLTN